MSKDTVTLKYRPTPRAFAPGYRPGATVRVDEATARALEATGAWTRVGRQAKDTPAGDATAAGSSPVQKE